MGSNDLDSLCDSSRSKQRFSHKGAAESTANAASRAGQPRFSSTRRMPSSRHYVQTAMVPANVWWSKFHPGGAATEQRQHRGYRMLPMPPMMIAPRYPRCCRMAAAVRSVCVTRRRSISRRGRRDRSASAHACSRRPISDAVRRPINLTRAPRAVRVVLIRATFRGGQVGRRTARAEMPHVLTATSGSHRTLTPVPRYIAKAVAIRV
jgi:hypothetical protein